MATTNRASDMMSSRTPERARATLTCGSSSYTCSKDVLIRYISSMLLLVLYLWLYPRDTALSCRAPTLYCRDGFPIIIWYGCHYGQLFKILKRHRCGNSPLQCLASPLIGLGS